MKRINEDIKNNEFKNVYLLFGEEDYLKQQYRDKLVHALTEEDDTMNFARFEGKGLSEGEIIDLRAVQLVTGADGDLIHIA